MAKKCVIDGKAGVSSATCESKISALPGYSQGMLPRFIPIFRNGGSSDSARDGHHSHVLIERQNTPATDFSLPVPEGSLKETQRGTVYRHT